MLGEFARRSLADAAALMPLVAAEHAAAEKRAGRKHHRPSLDPAAVGQNHTADPMTIEDQRVDVTLDDRQTCLACQHVLDRTRITTAIGLHARPLHRCTLAAVEHTIVDRGRICGPPDQAIERVDLAHDMALAQPADGRIARHRADVAAIMADEQGGGTAPCGGGGGFGAGMAAADDDHVKHATCLGDDHLAVKSVPRGTSLTDAELSEQSVQHRLGRIDPED